MAIDSYSRYVSPMSEAAEVDRPAGRITLEAERRQAARLAEELQAQIALCDEEATALRKLLAN